MERILKISLVNIGTKDIKKVKKPVPDKVQNAE